MGRYVRVQWILVVTMPSSSLTSPSVVKPWIVKATRNKEKCKELVVKDILKVLHGTM